MPKAAKRYVMPNEALIHRHITIHDMFMATYKAAQQGDGTNDLPITILLCAGCGKLLVNGVCPDVLVSPDGWERDEELGERAEVAE